MKYIAIALALLACSCTQNQMSRAYGGTQTMDIKAGHKVVNITWKNLDMWVLTRPMRADEVPETLTFHESSNFGVWEGTIVLREHAAKAEVAK